MIEIQLKIFSPVKMFRPSIRLVEALQTDKMKCIFYNGMHNVTFYSRLL